eukprot:GSA25T00005925001.1
MNNMKHHWAKRWKNCRRLWRKNAPRMLVIHHVGVSLPPNVQLPLELLLKTAP